MNRDLLDLMLVWLVFFFYIVPMSMCSPILGRFAQSLGADAVIVGSIFAMSGTVGLVTRMPLATVSDKIGLRVFILVGLVLIAMPPIAYLLASEPSVILAAQVLGGLGGSCFLSQMYSFSATKFLSKGEGGPARGKQAIGYAVTGMTVAATVAPTFTSLILYAGGTYQTVFTAAALLGFIGVAVAFMVVRGEAKAAAGGSSQGQEKEKGKGGIRGLLSTSFGLLLFAKTASNYGTKGVKTSFVPLFASERLGFSDAQLPLLQAVGTIPNVIARPVAGMIKRSETTVLAFACVLASISYGLVYLSGQGASLVALIWIGMMLNGFADGLFTPTGVAYAAKIAPQKYRSLGMALVTMGLDAGGALGSFVSGSIAGSGYDAIFLVTMFVTFSGVIIKFGSRQKKRETEKVTA